LAEVPLKLYALFGLPNLSAVKVAPVTVPLLAFTLSSFAFPLKDHQPTNPLVETYCGTCAIVVAVNPNIAAIVKNKFFFMVELISDN
jgi:hypothetical protein